MAIIWRLLCGCSATTINQCRPAGFGSALCFPLSPQDCQYSSRLLGPNPIEFFGFKNVKGMCHASYVSRRPLNDDNYSLSYRYRSIEKTASPQPPGDEARWSPPKPTRRASSGGQFRTPRSRGGAGGRLS